MSDESDESDESDRSYTSDQALDRAARYYDRFSRVYDVLLSPRYYRPPREAGVEALALEAGRVVLNVPCGTGQNVDLFRDDVTRIDAEWAASRSARTGTTRCSATWVCPASRRGSG